MVIEPLSLIFFSVPSSAAAGAASAVPASSATTRVVLFKLCMWISRLDLGALPAQLFCRSILGRAARSVKRAYIISACRNPRHWRTRDRAAKALGAVAGRDRAGADHRVCALDRAPPQARPEHVPGFLSLDGRQPG